MMEERRFLPALFCAVSCVKDGIFLLIFDIDNLEKAGIIRKVLSEFF